jgi:hypothetical protein
MKRINQLLFFLLLTSFCTFGQEVGDKVQDIKEGDWILLEEPNYSIKYPNDWDLNQSKQMGTEFFILSKLSDEEDKFSENVNLLIQDFSGNDFSLDYYIKNSENQLKLMVTDYKLLTSKRMNMSQNEYHKFIYNGIQGVHKLTIEQYVWMFNKKAYILTFTCIQDEFEKYKLMGEKILDSFTLKE